MNIPYIGITDFTNFEQVKAMLKVFNAHKQASSPRKLHVGVMMSYKTLNDIASKWQKAFPPKESIAGIFGSNETYNCLHYADYDGQADFANTLTKVISFGGIGIHAVQLDMIWPDPVDIMNGVRNSRKKIQVILQIGRNALEEINNDTDELIERLQDYRVIHRVLLDKSMGKGLGMDAEMLLPFAQVIREYLPEIGIGVAGGLGPDTMHLVEPIVEEFPSVSIDAQGRLRPSGNALDPIDWDMAKNYLINSLRLLN